MAQPTYQWEVITPFANNGSKDAIPDTTEDGSVSMESGYGTLYETPPSEGGRFIKRTEWNYLINFLYNAVKELQQIITAGEFTVSASQTLTNILPISLGGTGANSVEQAKINFSLNNVDNTSDINKPISTATQNALNDKVNTTSENVNVNIRTTDGVSDDYVTSIELRGANPNSPQIALVVDNPNNSDDAIDIILHQTTTNSTIYYRAKTHAFTGNVYENNHRLAPLPVSTSGNIGQIFNITAIAGASTRLPDGGTWFVSILSFAGNSVVNGQITNLMAGGSVIGNATIRYEGFAWRIA